MEFTTSGFTDTTPGGALTQAPTFHWADYLILVLVLLLSGSIGVFYGIKQRNSNNVDQFLVAGRSMPILPVSISLFVSWLSAISFIGDPVEAYYFGSIYWVITLGYALAVPVVAHFFAPIYFRKQLISVNEFLRGKYGPYVSGVIVVIGCITGMLYLGVALYAPSIALSQMGGINVNLCIVIIGVVCIVYTSLGGMKAVLWADTIQTVVMLGGFLACVIEGTKAVGGVAQVINIANQGGRINFFKFDPNPLARATFWTYLIGGFFRVFNPYIAQQAWVQRYVTLKSERDLKIALYLNIPLYILFVSLFAFAGLVMYAYFHGCDPLTAGKVNAPDQMIPFMVMETLGRYPGVPGLFLATLCSAALSTLSSGQNALSAIGLKDIVLPIHFRRTGEQLSDKMATLAVIALSVFFGVLNIGVAFVILQLKETSIFALTLKTTGAIGAPLAGIFVLAIVFPFVDVLSVIIGGTISLAVSLWIAVGSFVNPPAPYPGELLPTTTHLCYTTGLNYTATATTPSLYTTPYSQAYNTSGTFADTGFAVNELYKMSPALFGALGCVLTVLIGLVVQGFTDLVKLVQKRRADKYDNQYKNKSYTSGEEVVEMEPLSNGKND